MFYFNFFHPALCEVGGSATMEVAAQCNATHNTTQHDTTQHWQNCMHLAEGGERCNNLPCHAYLLGRWWHDTKHSPLNNNTKQHTQHLCSTWLIVSSSHFQKLPEKTFLHMAKNAGTSSGITQMCWTGWFGEKKFPIWIPYAIPGRDDKLFLGLQRTNPFYR